MLASKSIPHASGSRLPKILIAGHERSGVQFLTESLICNFGYQTSDHALKRFQDVPSDSYDLSVPCDHELAHLPGHWSAGLLRSHYEFGFYADWLRSYGKGMRVIYIVRDVVPVLQSYQRYLFQLEHFEGPRVPQASQFIRATPAGAMLRFQHQRAETMVHRWRNHVLGWLGKADFACRLPFVLRFDALNEDFHSTMRDIASFLQLPLPPRLARPPHRRSTALNHITSAMPEFRLTDQDLEFIGSVTTQVHETIAQWSRSLSSS